MELLVTIFLRHLIMYVAFHVANSASTPLRHVFHYYEPLYYDHLDLKSQHTRVRRSTDDSIYLKLSAFKRTFNLQLKHNPGIFKDDIQIEGSHGPINADTRKVYKGHVKGEESHVDGLITSTGHFQGQIHIVNETYFIEPAHVYFPVTVEFQSIIYRSTDVKFDFNSSFCKSDDLHHKLVSELQVNEDNSDNDNLKFQHHKDEKWNERYVYSSDHKNERKKRAIDPAKTVCELYLQADHLFYQKYGSNHETVIEQLGSYVQAINTIFGPIDFNFDSSSENIQFVVKRIKIYDDESAPGYKYAVPLSVDKLLDLHSTDNYNGFCLSYLFTDRDFNDGVLGLAWVASLTSAGGVCQKYTRVTGGKYKSLNTGTVTVLNYGKMVASAVIQVTFAHEIGHNFGSNHDTDGTSCAPGGTNGNYIMYARATSGYLPNNRKYSNCSIQSIWPILESKALDSAGCFIATPTSICGNRIVEGSEECDCGWDDECDDICCHPATTTGNTSQSCKYNNTQGLANFCSPSNGLCCSASCSVLQASDNFVCRQNTSCRDKATCDGSGVECPASTSVANGTMCAAGQVCFLGECTGSICLANNLKSCQCAGTGWDDPKLCDLCCEDNNGTCRVANEIVPSISETKAVEGSPCYNFQGYCDVFDVCREVNPNGLFNNLRKLLFSGELLDTLKDFLTEKWYVTLCVALGIVILMGLFIKFCSKSTGPKKDKKKRRGSRVSPDVLHM